MKARPHRQKRPTPANAASPRARVAHHARRRLALALTAGSLVIGAAAAAGAVASPELTHCSVNGGMPDHSCTAGALNPNVTQSNIQQTICVAGYTKTIRPSVSYTNPLKAELMRSYSLSGPASSYELDHLISLELGGNPTSPSNLWPEPYLPVPGAHEKDKVENYLHSQVCGGQMSLAQAQHVIATDWLSEWNSIKT